MSRPLASTHPFFLRVTILAFTLALLLPVAALAHDASAATQFGDTDGKTRSYNKEETLGAEKELGKRGEIEVEPDLLVMPDPEDAFAADLQVLPDPWMCFSDVMEEVEKVGGPENVWYVASGWLNYMVGEGLISGYVSNGWFGPYDDITRGQVAVILYRAECAKNPTLVEEFGSSTDPSDYAWSCEFKDMMGGAYYTAAINWAKDAGILTGDTSTGCTTVRPNDPVARQELCLMLARYANGGEVPDVGLDPAKAQGILGMSTIASWARDGVYWAVNNDVIGGVDNGDGTFSMDPTGTTWRSAAAKMFTVVMRDVL